MARGVVAIVLTMAWLGIEPASLHARPEPRSTLEALPFDVTVGSARAPVHVFGVVDLAVGGAETTLHTLVRLFARADDEGLRVTVRPRLDPDSPATIRAARLLFALPEGARRRWLIERVGARDEPEALAARLCGGWDALQGQGDAPETDSALIGVLQEQVRLGVGPTDAIFVNGARVEPPFGEQAVLFVARRLGKAGHAVPPAQAEEIGPLALEPGPAGAPLALIVFLDVRDPHSRRLARHVSEFMRRSALAPGCALHVAAFPRDRHAEAYGLAALAHCAQAEARPADVLDGLFGGPCEDPDVDAAILGAMLGLGPDGGARLAACAAASTTAEAVLAERAAARQAGVRGPPAVFLGGRRLLPRSRGFSRPFLEEVIVSYYQRTWVLPEGSRLGDDGTRSATPGSERRNP